MARDGTRRALRSRRRRPGAPSTHVDKIAESTYVDDMSARDAMKLAESVDSTDPAVGLRAVASLRTLVERLEALHVAQAREQDWSWQEIGGALGVSKQAVHRKHGGGLLRGRRGS